jgi:hypothetical protein
VNAPAPWNMAPSPMATGMAQSRARPRVVILGAGFTG